MSLPLLAFLYRLCCYAWLACMAMGVSQATLVTREGVAATLSDQNGTPVLDYRCAAVTCPDLNQVFDPQDKVALYSATNTTGGYLQATSDSSSQIGNQVFGSGYADAEVLLGDTLALYGRTGTGLLDFSFYVVAGVSGFNSSGEAVASLSLGGERFDAAGPNGSRFVRRRVPFRFGEPIQVEARAFSRVNLSPESRGPINANSYVLIVQILALDDQGQLLSNLQYRSDSSFRYPIERAEPIPEASPSVLCGTGLLGCLLAALRRRAK